MTNFDLWGPWTGNSIHTIRPFQRRSRFKSLYLVAAVLAVGVGSLIAIGSKL